LADGAYAAIHVEGGAAIGNAGIVDLGDRTLVYDAFMSPQAAVDLRAAAENLFGRPISTVVDSHWHNDHIWGNQAFSPDTEIVSTEETRRMLIATRGHGAYEEFMAEAEANLEATRASLHATEDEGERRQIAMWVDYHQSVVDLKPVLEIRAPTLTFTRRLVFHGTERSAELIAFSGGHTESDVVLFLPQERIAFMSDLLFIGHHPYLGGGDPDSFRQILDDVYSLAPELVVPGHGPVGSVEDVKAMSRYVSLLDELARKMVEAGEAEETIDAMPIPHPYEDWLLASFFPVNLHYYYQRWLEKQISLSP
jgi:glyoxylase-like metal-dependent hydrolase (beta-lactamase superfamily II)